MLPSAILPPSHVRLPLGASTKRDAIRELCALLASTTGADVAAIQRAVEDREEKLSTGIGFGVAIPHGRSPAVAEVGLVAGVTRQPIPFQAIDGQPVRLLFLLVGPDTAAGDHVRLLSKIARLVRREPVRQRLLDAADADRFVDALASAERDLLTA
ncbi:MAG: PTS sugar transporter subunit IIA [Gemmatimonadales bacterium]|nr:PTS sugar transporter subunit IIA [Gemmatimonadales bacterium]